VNDRQIKTESSWRRSPQKMEGQKNRESGQGRRWVTRATRLPQSRKKKPADVQTVRSQKEHEADGTSPAQTARSACSTKKSKQTSSRKRASEGWAPKKNRRRRGGKEKFSHDKQEVKSRAPLTGATGRAKKLRRGSQ